MRLSRFPIAPPVRGALPLSCRHTRRFRPRPGDSLARRGCGSFRREEATGGAEDQADTFPEEQGQAYVRNF